MILAARVDTLLDVRAVASSRKAGFSKMLLSASVNANGMTYRHDRRLGTPKAGRVAARAHRTADMRVIFTDHMATEQAQAGLADAVRQAGTAPICLLCFEREPHDCHRSIVADMIRAQTGQTIRHL